MANITLESVLDEEMREVLAMLEKTSPRKQRGSASSAASRRAASPMSSPRSPARSMLNVDNKTKPRSASIGSPNGATASSKGRGPVRSMLDVNISPPPKTTSKSAHTSPTEATHKSQASSNLQHRSLSDAATRPTSLGPRSGVDPESAYQFSGYLPSNPGGPVIPKRNTQAGKKVIPSAMAEVFRGGDLSAFPLLPREKARNQVGGTGTSSGKSKSPHSHTLRSNSPHQTLEANKLTLKDGKVIEKSSAYRRLSDANLALSGGKLSLLSKKGLRRRTISGEESSARTARLEKDYTPIDGEDAVADSSDEDSLSSEEDLRRGRQHSDRDDQVGDDVQKSEGTGSRTAQSLLAAVEEESKQVAAKEGSRRQSRSMLEPAITVTAPAGDKMKSAKRVIHPNTSFDEAASGLNTPVDSDTEADLTDIKRAQKLSMNMTAIASTPSTSRCVRTLYRGDFSKMQQEAKDNQRRVRKYLVATDLSDEAAHALEWTIGTVLRDGDTLLAIYCVDEDTGIAQSTDSGDDIKMQEQAAVIAASTKSSVSTPILGPVISPSPLGQGFRLGCDSTASSPMGRERGKAEQERYRAVQDITERVSRLLRKTKLQVKVVIEVIHCKSPKHLITEVIDYISPTLVILGSRGRSALKGVILGSFSNYLVTKSSVPVMVARKRLRKHTKYKRPAVRLANNLANPTLKTLACAKID